MNIDSNREQINANLEAICWMRKLVLKLNKQKIFFWQLKKELSELKERMKEVEKWMKKDDDFYYGEILPIKEVLRVHLGWHVFPDKYPCIADQQIKLDCDSPRIKAFKKAGLNVVSTPSRLANFPSISKCEVFEEKEPTDDIPYEKDMIIYKGRAYNQKLHRIVEKADLEEIKRLNLERDREGAWLSRHWEINNILKKYLEDADES